MSYKTCVKLILYTYKYCAPCMMFKVISILIQACYYIMLVVIRFGCSMHINITLYALKPVTY